MSARCIAIAGASGLVGTALADSLAAQGHRVLRLVRRAARGPDEVAWVPGAGQLYPEGIAEADAVVNLAGVNVGAGGWTARRRAEILASRIESTRTLVRAMARAGARPRVLVCASATGFYGDRGDEWVDETTPGGDGFLADVCRSWEAEAGEARRAGVRTVQTRFGVVLTPRGGALAKMLPVFRLGLGGRLGTGRQWMSWVSLRDAVAAIEHVLASEALDGPVNVVAPAPVTNAEFTRALGEALGRPAFWRVPAVLLRVALGRMAQETLLASTRARPQRLAEDGFQFSDTNLPATLAWLLPA